MENRKELLEQYVEDGKLPLKGELFARKSVVGGKLEEFREEKRADALTSRSERCRKTEADCSQEQSYLLESSGPVCPAFRNRRLLLSVGREDYV